MRLRKINVSGFKSFVDPTSIALPSDLIGIVGPNGCGKSNVIDAVRWVMGESSARHLRGESMSDVIFNGSNTRKPVGQAQVELIFDNSEGRLGERYAAYSEISVKRVLGRDGASQYALNGTRCRRRDITDLFLGTGLGPRSYAVIEQGMISRLIEARPEELRDFLEEVAGISRYKERRRETENRIRHTREHLERLTDVREELGRQLNRLERQAQQAERYKRLKGEEREVKGQLVALRWQYLNQRLTGIGAEVSQARTAVEAAITALRATEAALETKRETARERTEAANVAYRAVLEAGALVARTEEAINSAERERQQADEAVGRQRAALDQAQSRHGTDEQQLGDVEDNLRESEPELARLEDSMGDARESYAQHEQRMHHWQAHWQELANQAQQPSQSAHAERARIDSFEDRLTRLKDQLARTAEQRAALDLSRYSDEYDNTRKLAETAASEEQLAQSALTVARDAVEHTRAQQAQDAHQLHEQRTALQQLQGQQASLRALQEDALGSSGSAVEAAHWLAQHNLRDAPRLAESLQVQSGWEHAVETVLGDALEMLLVPELDDALRSAVAHVTDHTVGVAERTPTNPSSMGGDGTLADKVRGPAAVVSLLRGVRVASDTDAANRLRDELASDEIVITPDGALLGSNWVQAPGRERADGVLARVQQLREIESQLQELAHALGQLEQSASEREFALHGAEQALESVQQDANATHRASVAADAACKAAAAEQERAQGRARGFDEELDQADARRTELEGELGAARARLSSAVDELEAVERARNEWNASRDDHRQQLDASRNAWQQIRDEAYQLGLRVEGWRTRREGLKDSLKRNAEEVEHLIARLEELSATREQLDVPLANQREQLQVALGGHQKTEADLSAARDAAESIDAELRALAGSRTQFDQRVEQAREQLNQARLRQQETRVRRDTLQEQLAQDDDKPVAVWLEAMPEEATEAQWETRLEDLERRISRLGAINLAAIEEHAEHSERKTYLDAQHADLEEALETLENAIKRIDRETRTRFKDTFERVNQGLSERFPKLFGGGRAYLQLTGEDVLDAGVSIMAQPPGKRNASIQLLSGGEKALTAVALVFAMFDLNPAPFCLLDEVDAPLDDANVGRFSQLVKEMSSQVQMLVVTHNKVTMEVAQQLLGVTMNEPGVSRLVAVDIDDAVAMTHA
jgi:chromosome segregation protein